MKNEFKKSYSDKKVDSEGNKLTEDIREVTNEEHKDKVLKARERLDSYIRFRCTGLSKVNFKLAAENEPDMSEGEISRKLHDGWSNGSIKLN